jgi:hypothetical protein
VSFTPHTISSRAPSAARTSLRCLILLDLDAISDSYSFPLFYTNIQKNTEK